MVFAFIPCFSYWPGNSCNTRWTTPFNACLKKLGHLLVLSVWLYFCLSSLLWSSLSWCSTQQMWWLLGTTEPLWWCPPQLMGHCCMSESCRSSTTDGKPPKNVTAVTVQQPERVQPRAAPILTAGAGRGAAASEGFWVPSCLFYHQANPLGPLETKRHLDTVLGNGLKVSLLVPGEQDDLERTLLISTILCSLSFPRRLDWLRCERFLRECEMWLCLKSAIVQIFWSFNSVLSFFSIKTDLLHFFQ